MPLPLKIEPFFPAPAPSNHLCVFCFYNIGSYFIIIITLITTTIIILLLVNYISQSMS